MLTVSLAPMYFTCGQIKKVPDSFFAYTAKETKHQLTIHLGCDEW